MSSQSFISEVRLGNPFERVIINNYRLVLFTASVILACLNTLAQHHSRGK